MSTWLNLLSYEKNLIVSVLSIKSGRIAVDQFRFGVYNAGIQRGLMSAGNEQLHGGESHDLRMYVDRTESGTKDARLG
jgi:hypothetical protein